MLLLNLESAPSSRSSFSREEDRRRLYFFMELEINKVCKMAQLFFLLTKIKFFA